MPEWTTEERQKVFEDYYLANRPLTVEAYANGLPKTASYVRGILDGTHYALDMLPIVFRLFTQMNSKFTFAKPDEERSVLAGQWVIAMTHLQQSIGIGKLDLVGGKFLLSQMGKAAT